MKVTSWRKSQDIWPISKARAVDGDTLEAEIHLGFGHTTRARVRLKGWWASELTGPHGQEGLAAQKRLQGYLDNRVLWIHCPTERRDRYGRVLAHLMHENRIVNPKDVLGAYQLTEAEHNARRKAPAGAGRAGGGGGTVGVALRAYGAAQANVARNSAVEAEGPPGLPLPPSLS